MRLHSEECRPQDSWISHCFYCISHMSSVTVAVLCRQVAASSVPIDAVLAEQLAFIAHILSVGSQSTSMLLNTG